jgi:hypothetical protein
MGDGYDTAVAGNTDRYGSSQSKVIHRHAEFIPRPNRRTGEKRSNKKESPVSPVEVVVLDAV